MKIGIPKALLYHKYNVLWRRFFEYLNIETIVSPKTNKKILKMGNKYSIDESCLSSKIFMGHVEYLLNKCDFILIPRIASLEKDGEMCPKFYGMPDNVTNTFKKAKIIVFEIDVNKRIDEKKAFMNLGTFLNINKKIVKKAYRYAKYNDELIKWKNILEQEEKLKEKKLKILIGSHNYNLEDEFEGKPIIEYLEKNDINVILANVVDLKKALKKSLNVTNKLYWTYNKELIGGIEIYKNRVDGIILLSSFPCGCDSLVNDILLRKINNIPITNIILDEQDSFNGLQTRLESFIDIIKMQKKGDKNE